MVGLIIAFIILFLAARWLRKMYNDLVSKNPELIFRRSDSVAFRSFSNDTTLSAIDHTLVFTGTKATTASLPDASTCAGRIYSISNFSTITPTPILTITSKNLQFIEGQPHCSLWLVDQSVMIISDGANWKIIRQYIPSSSRPWKTKASSVSYRNVETEKATEKSQSRAVFYDISGN